MPPVPLESRRRETAAKVAALTLANAFIFQEQLALADGRVRSVRSLLDEGDILQATSDHWKFICDTINYVPIFRLARDILNLLPASASPGDSVRRLAREALSITQKKAALRHDLMGRIYHWLLHDAKYLGTYYTSVPAATLLLKVSLEPWRYPHVNWSSLEDIEHFVVGDLACGTGTLLMAATQTITDNFITARASSGLPVTPDDLKALHRLLMERVIHGYDVLPSAIHLTAATLGLLAPEIAFRKMCLYWVPMGRQTTGEIHLGSIDYIDRDSLTTQLDITGTSRSGGAAGAVTGAGMASSTAPLPNMSLCVMNPPFVRSVGGNLLFGSLPRDRAVMQRKLSQLLRAAQTRGRYANATAGLGSVFALVADRHIPPQGILSLLIPAAVSTGVAWSSTRSLINDRYHLQVFISNHDAEKWSFSENTELSEIMLVAKKRRAVGSQESDVGERASQQTVFVNLWVSPTTSAEGLAAADAIERAPAAAIGAPGEPTDAISSIMVGSKKIGEKLSIPTAWLRTRPWLGAAFAQTDLVRGLVNLREGVVRVPGSAQQVSIPITTIGDLGELGPDRRDIYDGFTVGEIETPFPALWGHQAEETTSIAASPNRWLSPLAEAAQGRPLRSSSVLWERAGRIMFAERLWMATQRLVAVRLAEPALSNVWWPFATPTLTDEQDKSLAIWLNSTLGLILFLGHRTPTRGPWVQFKKPSLQEMPALDVRALTTNQLTKLAACYDDVAEEVLSPLSQMADDERRAAMDRAVADAFGLPKVDAFRRLLSREPVISDTRLQPAAGEMPESSDQFSLF